MNLIIFDCDGVLVESEAVFIEAEMSFLEEAGFSYRRDDYIRQFMGLPPDIWKARIHDLIVEKHGKAPPLDFFDHLYDRTRTKLEAELVAVAGARETILSLSQRKCVASSSSAKSMVRKLALTDLLDLFDDNLFSTQLVENGKPAPDLFLLAAERMGIAPSECVVVEDSSNGVIAATRAGMRVIGFTGGSHCPDNHGEILRGDGADVVVSSYPELAAVINRV